MRVTTQAIFPGRTFRLTAAGKSNKKQSRKIRKCSHTYAESGKACARRHIAPPEKNNTSCAAGAPNAAMLMSISTVCIDFSFLRPIWRVCMPLRFLYRQYNQGTMLFCKVNSVKHRQHKKCRYRVRHKLLQREFLKLLSYCDFFIFKNSTAFGNFNHIFKAPPKRGLNFGIAARLYLL